MRQESFRHIILDSFKSWGYQPVLPPTLESLEALEAGRPKFLQECFKVIDAEGNLLALRADLTLPLARLAATRLNSVSRPLRLCYAAKVFRASPHLADERREIYQAGIELVGSYAGEKEPHGFSQTNKSNMECLSILLETLEAVGLEEYKIVLSHTDLWRYAGEIFHRIEELLRQNLSESLDELLAKGKFVDYQAAISQIEDRAKKALSVNSDLKNFFATAGESPLSYLADACFQLTGEPKDILNFLDQDSTIYQELSEIIRLGEIYGHEKFLLDFTLRPDPDFYTGLYFEVIIPGHGKSIGHGGRYDNLIASFGKSEPAIGFSLQMDPLLKYGKPYLVQEHLDAFRIPFERGGADLIDTIAQTRKLRLSHKVVILD